MNENKETPRKYQEGLFTAISAGFFLLLVGTLFIITPNLFDSIQTFIGDIGIVDVPNTSIILPSPENIGMHSTVYQTAGQFSIAIAVLQIIILALRFIIPSSWGKKSETVGNFIYWTGAAYIIQLFLIESTQWFVFWSMILVIVGISLIARAATMTGSRI